MTCRRLILCWGLLLPFLSATGSAQPPEGVPIFGLLPLKEPNAIQNLPPGFQPRFMYLETDVESEHEFQSSGSPSASVTHDRILVQSVLGLGLAGSIYHPNLLEYAGLAELGLDYHDARVAPGNQASDCQFLQRYHISVEILRKKPFATSLFADKDFVYRDYDFFSRGRVDSERFGVRSGYAAGPVPVSVSFQHYDENVLDLTRPARLTEDTLSFNARNSRRLGKGNTQINYDFNRFSRVDDGFSSQRGLNQNLSAIDLEDFGAHDWIHLTSLLNYNSVTETMQPSEKLLFQEHLQLQHTRRLQSFYEYEFDDTSAGAADAITHQGRLGLTHQLYDNLTSTLDLHGNTTDAASPGNSLNTSRYGGTLSESYTRNLGSWGNLTLGYVGGIDHEEREAVGGLVEIINEPHTLTDGAQPAFLNQLFVVEPPLILVTDTNGIAYQRNSDYSVIAQGARTEIRRITGGTIPNGSTVYVTYSAVLEPSAHYTSFANGANFRLDFWKGLLGIYARWTSLDYSGGQQLSLRWVDDKTFGVDSTWRWLRAGAEYQVVDSNLSPYNHTRLFESAQFRPSELATLSIDLDQGWTTFRDTNTRQTSYGLITRYQQRLTSTLAWSAEGGVRIERGFGFDRDYATVRTELNWAIGKLKVKLGYEYGNESHPTDLRERHYCYLRARRTF
jgi:hypothetical protein